MDIWRGRLIIYRILDEVGRIVERRRENLAGVEGGGLEIGHRREWRSFSL